MDQDQNYKNMNSGVLNKEQIQYAFDNYSLIDEYDPNGLQSCSYDLRVGTIYKEGIMIEDEPSVNIEPGEIVAIFTLESVNLPNDMFATVFPINKQSSEGFMVLNPGHIDPGYKGIISVKAINLRKNQLPIMRGEKIFTIIFEKLPFKTEVYNKNISNEQKKRDQLKKEREVSPENIFYIPRYWKEKKVFAYTENDVKAIVTQNAIANATFAFAIIALLISVISLAYVIFKDINYSKQNHATVGYTQQSIIDSND